MNGKAHIHFSSGTTLQEIDKATYPGGDITKHAGGWSELINRINIALATCNKLEIFCTNELLTQMEASGLQRGDCCTAHLQVEYGGTYTGNTWQT